MRGDASAYEVLGLQPGADASAIECAYKVLIKRYHPDREGGDAARAAEINHAYFQLRQPVEQPPERPGPASVAEAIYARHAAQTKRRVRRRRVRTWPFVLLAAGLILYINREAVAVLVEDGLAEIERRMEAPIFDGADAGAAPGASVSLDGPIEQQALAASVREAISLHRRGDEEALADTSRSCHQRLRAAPTLKQLDRCAAFDDAVLELQQRDPLGDEGPFGPSGITARQMHGATLLSDDYFAIEARLDRVRSRVQVMLAPPAPQHPPVSALPQPAP